MNVLDRLVISVRGWSVNKMHLKMDVVLSVARHLVSERVRPLKYSGSYQRYATNFSAVSLVRFAFYMGNNSYELTDHDAPVICT